MTFFNEFGKKWASEGSVEPISETQKKSGWDFLGSVPPISGQFNLVQQNTDEKINYLFNLINSFVISRGGTLNAVSTNALRDILNNLLMAVQGGHVGYATKDGMLLDTTQEERTIAEVLSDPVAENNGFYLWLSGEWVKQIGPWGLAMSATDASRIAAEEAAADADAAKTEAQTAAGLAVDAQADIHNNWQGKLDLAAQQAETATAQAGIATDKAAEASGSAATSNAAKTAAELARDAAMVGSVTYPDEATGRAAVADGAYFKVIGSGDVAAREYCRTNASTSVLVAEYPSVVAVDKISDIAGNYYKEYVIGENDVFGSLSDGSAYVSANLNFGLREGLKATSKIYKIRIGFIASGTGEIHLYEPDGAGGYIVKAIKQVNLVAGVNQFDGSDIYDAPLSAGTLIHFVKKSGQIRATNNQNDGRNLSDVVQMVGQPMTGTFTNATYTPDIQIETISAYGRATIDKRLVDLESKIPAVDKNIDDIIHANLVIGKTINDPNIAIYGDINGAITGNLPGSYIYGPRKAIEYNGYLDSVTFRSALNATTRIFIYEPYGNEYKIIKVIPVQSVVGINTVKIDMFVNSGCRVMCGGSLYYEAGTSGGQLGTFFLVDHATLQVGDINKLNEYGHTPHIEVKCISINGQDLTGAIYNLKNRVDLLEPYFYANKQINTLIKERFAGAVIPADWTVSGAWAVDNGLTSPSTGGWDCYAISPGDSSIQKRRFMARVRVDDSSSIFGICTKPPENSGGAVAMVDGVAGKLRLYSWNGTASAGSYTNEVALPSALVAGRYYLLEAEKNGLKCTIKMTDTVTQQSCSVSEEQGAAYRQWHGRAGIMFHAGAIKVDWFEVDALHPVELRAIIVGDSNSEGNFLPFGSPSWAFQIAEQRKAENDILLAVRAGDETPNFIARKNHDLLSWKPDYAVLALGTNDTSQATWRANMATTISEIVALGGEPILCTQIPRTASQALRSAMNNDIRNGYFGRYRYIDFAVAVSLNNDGVTWNPAYDYGDATHANAEGQLRMYQQVLIDAPFLLS